ncbi:uncharacterized protein EV420DRAFT_781562 [Desarmillaria tabescens]|uniref:F-box domain-containing protein n=1 Tax=Armillaria tabescens TaxID=1929756 RepID=A0AA39JVF7_ARMTA|nr:uncharacterized protein EV420DRAFT_781562 [Desarmillaria tabescens]KAK0449662.1 hypothetical protein EV420DRAFT_781562 [Desarmillaria tabescens]
MNGFHIESLFIQIRDRRNKLLQDLDNCKALLSPIQRLPRESLLEIFEDLSSSFTGISGAPWILGHVYSLWRMSSRSSPTLWTKISVRGPEISNVNFLTFYLSLSRDLPLDIYCGNITSSAMDALSCLAVHSARWSKLQLQMDPREFSQFLSFVSVPPVRLENLWIFICHYGFFDRSFLPALSCSNPFAASHIIDATFQSLAYPTLPIYLEELRKFSACI